MSDVRRNVTHKVRRYTRIRRPFVASGLVPDVKDNVARIRRSFVTSGLVPDVKDVCIVILAQAGIQSNNGCIQILPILWIPDQVRHDEIHRHSGMTAHIVIPADPGSGPGVLSYQF